MEEAIKRIERWKECGDDIMWLMLNNLNLDTLPPIPSNCLFLSCFGNKLTFLPNLYNIRNLTCSNNQLKSLPDLPNCYYLACNNNQLTSLPDSLRGNALLICRGNKYLFINNTYKTKRNWHADTEYSTNYPVFATKIQRTYRKYKQKRVFVELHKLYIKNISLLISWYI